MKKNARSFLFWVFDSLRGAPVKKHYEDIRKHFDIYGAIEGDNASKAKLKAILRHTAATVPYYKNFNPEEGLASFPVVNKSHIKESFNEFRSEVYKSDEELIPVITSGSTGTPFKIFQNKDKRYRNTADTLFFSGHAGFSLGEKLMYFKIWSDNNMKSVRNQKLQNIKPVDVLNLSETSEKVLEEIKYMRGPLHFIGYVSALEELCKTLEKKPFLKPAKGKFKSIITMSEFLDPITKSAGENFFGCPVLSRYSNVENGILAQQTNKQQQNFVVNISSYHIEILDLQRDEVVPNGTVGRIVVTDYYNYATPMIRYDTGDLGSLEECEEKGNKRLCLTRVEGRKLDQLFTTKGNLISSYVVYKNMWKYTEIDQYQLVQSGPGKYIFKINANKLFQREAELKEEFLKFLGEDALFTVEYVKDIPLLDSGKRKKVVNLNSKNNSPSA